MRPAALAKSLSLLILLSFTLSAKSDMLVKPDGLTFPDATIQSTAGSPLSHIHLAQNWAGPTGLFATVSGINARGIGARASNVDFNSAALYGDVSDPNSAATGVWGRSFSNSASSTAVFASAGQDETYQGAADALFAIAYGTGNAVWGVAGEATATAGRFSGNVIVTGTLSKGAGSFKIDHPLDPKNKYLYHSFVESPDMKNIYDGMATFDPYGEAMVQMPEWFEALNRDFRYQLTAVGSPSSGMYIAEKVKDNQFRIAGGTPGGEVSWMVTGIRQDAFAMAHRIPIEEEKPERERGTYLHPDVFDGSVSVIVRTESDNTSAAAKPPKPTP